MCYGRLHGLEPQEELQGSVASPSEVSATRGPMGWLFPAAFGCSGETTEKKARLVQPGKLSGWMEVWRGMVLWVLP